MLFETTPPPRRRWNGPHGVTNGGNEGIVAFRKVEGDLDGESTIDWVVGLNHFISS